MRKTLILMLLALAFPAQSGVFKWTDEQGNVHYTDRPVEEAEKLRVPGLPKEQATSSAPESATSQSADEDLAPRQAVVPEDLAATDYTEFELVSPQEGQTFRNNEGKVDVGILLQPPLAAGHQIRLLLDGVPVEPLFTSTQLILNDVSRGSHKLEVRIMDDEGAVQAVAPAVNFHMRQAPRPELSGN